MVTKLKNYEFSDSIQAKISNEYCQRYKQLGETFDSLNLPEAKILPINYKTPLYNIEVRIFSLITFKNKYLVFICIFI